MKAKIYIDYGFGQDVVFGDKLKYRLERIKGDYQIKTYNDFRQEIEKNEKEIEEGEWEPLVLKALDRFHIVIPILSAEYLSFITEPIQKKFSELIESKNKYLFPILFGPSSWGSVNWVVKSKITPNDNIPISDYSTNEQDIILNDFVNTIGNIVANLNSAISLDSKKTANLDMKKKGSIFISHDHENADFAELLKLRLEKEGLSSWIDSERLKIGQDWREEIDSGIENSLAIIVLMTPDARKSEYVTYEWSFAWGKGKKIFPVMLKQTQLHPRLESLQYLDFTNRTIRPWNKLIEELKKITNNNMP